MATQITARPFKGLSHTRKAFASLGDDTTLSRFVKIPHAHKPKPAQAVAKGCGLPSIEAGRSLFHRKSVHAPANLKTLLVSGHSNVKIGRDVRKGHLRGYWIYTLSLEERATCPSSCHHWYDCYGNNMPWAKRVQHGAEMVERLDAEIDQLLAVRGRVGVLVRLHALGDFYSAEYVEFWRERLARHPRLAVFGYTAHSPKSEIGKTVAAMNRKFASRSMIRFSNGRLGTMSTVPIVDADGCPANAFVCPEQTGRTQCCATCGACWGTSKNVAFLRH